MFTSAGSPGANGCDNCHRTRTETMDSSVSQVRREGVIDFFPMLWRQTCSLIYLCNVEMRKSRKHLRSSNVILPVFVSQCLNTKFADFFHSCFHLTFGFERWLHHVTSKVASGARSRVGSGSPRHSPRHSPRGSPRTSRVAMRRQDRVPKQHPGVGELENEMRMRHDESMC